MTIIDELKSAIGTGGSGVSTDLAMKAIDEIERLREALKFYAQWTIVSAYIDDEIYDDRGDKARAALKEGK
jgi:hypothetical protein